MKDLGSFTGIEMPMSDINNFYKIEKNSLFVMFINQDD